MYVHVRTCIVLYLLYICMCGYCTLHTPQLFMLGFCVVAAAAQYVSFCLRFCKTLAPYAICSAFLINIKSLKSLKSQGHAQCLTFFISFPVDSAKGVFQAQVTFVRLAKTTSKWYQWRGSPELLTLHLPRNPPKSKLQGRLDLHPVIIARCAHLCGEHHPL